MKTWTYTKTNTNGYRWFLSSRPENAFNGSGPTHYTAQAQVRCTEPTRKGTEKAYYRMVGKLARFDTTTARDLFLATFAPEDFDPRR